MPHRTSCYSVAHLITQRSACLGAFAIPASPLPRHTSSRHARLLAFFLATQLTLKDIGAITHRLIASSRRGMSASTSRLFLSGVRHDRMDLPPFRSQWLIRWCYRFLLHDHDVLPRLHVCNMLTRHELRPSQQATCLLPRTHRQALRHRHRHQALHRRTLSLHRRHRQALLPKQVHRRLRRVPLLLHHHLLKLCGTTW